MGVLDQYINTPEIQEAQKAADTAVSKVQEYGSSMGNLPEKLRQAVMEKFNYNKDLIEQRNKAAADYFATPATARMKYGDIGNPMLTEKLVAQDKAIMYQPWMNLNNLLTNRMGTIDRTVEGLYQTAQSEYDMAKLSAEVARQKLQDLLGMGKDRASFDLQERQLAESRANKAAAGKPAGEKEKDRLLVDQWLQGADGLPGMEGVLVVKNRQEAIQEGLKLVANGFDSSVVSDEIDRYFPVKEKTSTMSPITVTVEGQTQVNGWRLKKADGTTVVIQHAPPPPKKWYELSEGESPTVKANKDPQAIYDNLKDAGYTDDQIIEYLKGEGFKIT